MSSPQEQSLMQERLIGDLRMVIENAEELLKNTNQHADGRYQGARSKLAQALRVANDELARIEDIQLTRMMKATAAANLLHNDATGEARLMRAFR